MSEKDQVKNILSGAGIKMDISGCGCCGSPSVKMTYKGEVIIDDDDAGFIMHEENRT